MGGVRAYEAEPPAPSPDSQIDPSKYSFRLVKLEIDPSPAVSGWKKYKVSLPAGVRQRHASDPIYGQDWIALLKDFDSKLLACHILPNWVTTNRQSVNRHLIPLCSWFRSGLELPPLRQQQPAWSRRNRRKWSQLNRGKNLLRWKRYWILTL